MPSRKSEQRLVETVRHVWGLYWRRLAKTMKAKRRKPKKKR